MRTVLFSRKVKIHFFLISSFCESVFMNAFTVMMTRYSIMSLWFWYVRMFPTMVYCCLLAVLLFTNRNAFYSPPLLPFFQFSIVYDDDDDDDDYDGDSGGSGDDNGG